MPEGNPKPAAKPTWEVHARPIGAAHEPWRVIRVAARSEIQAEAILRRSGYESVVPSMTRVPGPGDPVPPATLRPIVCTRCGYGLAGLTLESSAVLCPECSYPQPLVAWSKELADGAAGPHAIVWLFAIIGMLGSGFIVLVIFVSYLVSY